MDFNKLSNSVDSLVTKGIPIRIIFDEMSVLKMAGAALAVVILVALLKKFI